MPAVTGVMLEELDARIADGFGTTCRCRSIGCRTARFMRELL